MKKIIYFSFALLAFTLTACDNTIGCGLDGDMGNGTFTSEDNQGTGRTIQSTNEIKVESLLLLEDCNQSLLLKGDHQ